MALMSNSSAAGTKAADGDAKKELAVDDEADKRAPDKPSKQESNLGVSSYQIISPTKVKTQDT